MVRFLVNAIGTLILALALVFAVGDIARSIAQDAIRITAMGDAMGSIGLPFGPASGVTADLLATVSVWPAAPVLAVFAFLVFLLARPRETRGRRWAR